MEIRKYKFTLRLSKSVFLDIFRCQEYVKKGYVEMRKWIYLVPFLSAPGRMS